MFESLGARRTVTPDGVAWRVGRKWVPHRVRHSWRWRGNRGAEFVGDPMGWNGAFSAFDGTDLWDGLLILGAAVVLLLVVIPILLFGLELIIAGLLLAGGVVARLILGKPWTIEARALDGSEQVLRWRVVGWRRSRRLITQLRQDLAQGLELTPEQHVLTA